VWVHLRRGQVRGSVVKISDREIVVNRNGRDLTLSCAEIVRIDRERFNRRGAVTGATVAGVLAIVPGWNACGPKLGCWAAGLAVYGGLGALIGGAVGGRRTVYIAAPSSCPPPAFLTSGF
jgi:hypothetical protein